MNYCAVHRFNERFLSKEHKLCILSRLTYTVQEITPIS
jgi:hypothetical protein